MHQFLPASALPILVCAWLPVTDQMFDEDSMVDLGDMGFATEAAQASSASTGTTALAANDDEENRSPSVAPNGSDRPALQGQRAVSKGRSVSPPLVRTAEMTAMHARASSPQAKGRPQTATATRATKGPVRSKSALSLGARNPYAVATTSAAPAAGKSRTARVPVHLQTTAATSGKVGASCLVCVCVCVRRIGAPHVVPIYS